MEMNVINEVIARRFLLGEISAEERDRIQELAFADPDTFALIEATEADLIDDFVNDELSFEEKERFQNYFLDQPGRRQDLRIGRALQQYWARNEESVAEVADRSVPTPQPKRSRFLWFDLRPATVAPVLLTLLVAVTLLGIYVTWRRGEPPMQVKHQPTPPPATPDVSAVASPEVTPSQATPSPTRPHVQSSPSPAPRQSVDPFYALLVPGTPARSEGVEEKVPPDSPSIVFELPLITDIHRSYEAVLQKDGKDIHTWPNLHPKKLTAGSGLKVVAHPGLLENLQRYRIIVSGESAGKSVAVHSYYFVVSN
jgi:hypothetical protein